MNYSFQANKIKPNAKCHIWCKNYDKCFVEDLCCNGALTHRQYLKMIREDNIRYCKNYKFSKNNFNEWKKIREMNSRQG